MKAAELHQSRPSVEECPQEMIPALAGRRIFRVMYGDGRDIEKDDVEIIRKDLERGLKYGDRPSLSPTSSTVITLSTDTDGSIH